MVVYVNCDVISKAGVDAHFPVVGNHVCKNVYTLTKVGDALNRSDAVSIAFDRYVPQMKNGYALMSERIRSSIKHDGRAIIQPALVRAIASDAVLITTIFPSNSVSIFPEGNLGN